MKCSELDVVDLLKRAGLRPTRQRVALGSLLFGQCDRHVTAEQLYAEAQAASIKVSLATVYNTLHQFIAGGLLREIVMDPGRSYFDTNVCDHHHFYFEDSGQLNDIPASGVSLARMPAPPAGTSIRRIDVIIRVGADPAPDRN
jgi:Fur family iron response transcriptional regulator